MDKTMAGLLGVVAGLATAGSANAAGLQRAGSEAMPVASYADLLTPVPNAVALLKADNTARAQARVTQTADFYFSYGYRAPYRYGRPSYPYYAHPSYPYYAYRRNEEAWRPREHHHHHHYQRYDEDWR